MKNTQIVAFFAILLMIFLLVKNEPQTHTKLTQENNLSKECNLQEEYNSLQRKYEILQLKYEFKRDDKTTRKVVEEIVHKAMLKANEANENNATQDWKVPKKIEDVVNGLSSVKYKVKPGDSLYSIARSFNTTVDEIKRSNKIKNNLIKPKQVLTFSADSTYKETVKGTNKLVKDAKRYLGTRYRYGGTTKKGIDCSAFVKAVFKKNGKNLPRTSRQQAKVGKHVKKKDLKIGDLVFFAKHKTVSHVGMFIGNDKFIHASSGAKKVTITRLSKAYYKSHYKGARRVI